jgi:ribosomal protein S27E
VLVSLAAGAFCIALGYITAFEGFTETEGMEVSQVTYPVAGVLGMVIGVFTALVGSWRALVVTKEIIQVEEMVERAKESEKRNLPSHIVVCPNCGKQNRISSHPDQIRVFKCGVCGTKLKESTSK